MAIPLYINLSNEDFSSFLKSDFYNNWMKFLTNDLSEETKCKRCSNTFFWDGCPSCGNTFLSREILRQTS